MHPRPAEVTLFNTAGNPAAPTTFTTPADEGGNMATDEKIGLSMDAMIDFTPEACDALGKAIETQGYFYRSCRMTRAEFAELYPELPIPAPAK